MVVLLNTIGAREALYAYVTLNERLATEVSTIRRIDRRRLRNSAGRSLLIFGYNSLVPFEARASIH